MAGYGQFCPIARAADILCQRWTLLILRDMHAGCRRFNELRRGVPRMSPTLLSQRLKTLEEFGLIRRKVAEDGTTEYRLTAAGRETRPLLQVFGIWGQRWMQHKTSAGELDEAFLIYAMQIGIDARFLSPQSVVHIAFQDRPKLKWDRWWLLVDDGDVDACFDDPGRDVNVTIETDLKTLTDVWCGAAPLRPALDNGSIVLDGDRKLVDHFATWFRGSPFNIVDPPPEPADVPALLARLWR